MCVCIYAYTYLFVLGLLGVLLLNLGLFDFGSKLSSNDGGVESNSRSGECSGFGTIAPVIGSKTMSPGNESDSSPISKPSLSFFFL